MTTIGVAALRLGTVLARFGEHEPCLPVDLARPDAVAELQRIRYDHLGKVDTLLSEQQSHSGVRTEMLLSVHTAVLVWLEDLSGHPHPRTAAATDLVRAIIDTADALLLWHAVQDFFPTQRRVMFCLAELERAGGHAAAGNASLISGDDSELGAIRESEGQVPHG